MELFVAQKCRETMNKTSKAESWNALGHTKIKNGHIVKLLKKLIEAFVAIGLIFVFLEGALVQLVQAE